MKWFKHDSTATTDAKIKKLILKHGATGYAVYFHCLELITGNISENNVTFELEHDAELIADDLKICGDSNKSGIEIVEDIMRTIVDLNLFQEDNNRIFCFKLLKRIDSSMTSNSRLKTLVSNAKEELKNNHDTVMCNHDSIMNNHARLDKTRLDYTRLEESNSANAPVTPPSRKKFRKPTLEELTAYLKEKQIENVDPQTFLDYYESKGWKVGNSPMKDWKCTVNNWSRRDYSNKKDSKPYGTSLCSQTCDVVTDEDLKNIRF